MNQVLQVPDLKEELEQLLPRPELTLQIALLGYAAAELADSPRRPVAEVLVG